MAHCLCCGRIWLFSPTTRKYFTQRLCLYTHLGLTLRLLAMFCFEVIRVFKGAGLTLGRQHTRKVVLDYSFHTFYISESIGLKHIFLRNFILCGMTRGECKVTIPVTRGKAKVSYSVWQAWFLPLQNTFPKSKISTIFTRPGCLVWRHHHDLSCSQLTFFPC